MRRSIVDGQFYPSDPLELKNQVKNYLYFATPGEFKGKIISAVVPHAGYTYSGNCAADTYKTIQDFIKKKNKSIKTFIILGTNHSGLGSKISFSVEDFETPLGETKSDIPLIEEILRSCQEKKLEASTNESAHRNDHSIEVQLPFIQTISPFSRIVPVLLKNLTLGEILDFSAILSKAMKNHEDEKGSIILLASSDLTHYGPAYGYVPFFGTDQQKKEKLGELDSIFIKEILSMNTSEFYKKTEKSTVCGKDAISCCIEVSRRLAAKSAEKLSYYTSGDISRDYENAVGYVSVIFIN